MMDLFCVLARQGRTQRWLAGELGVHESVVSRAARGVRPLSLDMERRAWALLAGQPLTSVLPSGSNETQSGNGACDK